MGILSSSVSITRYKVIDKLEGPVAEAVEKGLTKNTISEIENMESDQNIGWTSFDNPFKPNFEGSSFVIGNYMVFSLRIDKKNIPAKIVTKHFSVEMAKQLAETGREYLSRDEKKKLKEKIIDDLSLRIPATPSVYDLLWNYEESLLLFLSNQKAANEELETLFSKSFKLTIVRLFPYTMADLNIDISDAERDAISKLSPTKFSE